MRGKLRSVLLLSASLTLLAPAAPVDAHLLERVDANETYGPLDIARSTFRHRDGRIRVTATTYGDWTGRMLTDSDFFFQFESRLGPKADFYVNVYYSEDGGRVVGRLYRWTDDGTGAARVGTVRTRKKWRTVAVSFRRFYLRSRPQRISWNAESYFIGGPRCPKSSPCKDLAPNRLLYTHWFR